ncbi:MAG: hypothetical protein WC417_07070, partial [Candidatus Omnitrophota bacterium]
MMKSRLSLKISAKAALCSLIITLFLSFIGCSSSTRPTFQKENIEQAITNICKKEYNINVKVTLFGSTLWIYFPTEDIVLKTDKPEKSTSIFVTEFAQI